MNNNLKKIFIKFYYVIFSNMMSLVASFIAILILPKIISITEYGYWQLYMFYISYVGIAHFGWIDGIYLTVGGKRFESLDSNALSSQLTMLTIFSCIMMICVFLFITPLVSSVEKKIISLYFMLNILLMNVRTLYVYLLQATDKIKESSKIIVIDRIIYSIVLVAMLLFGIRRFEILVLSDMVGKYISLIYCYYNYRHIRIGANFISKNQIKNSLEFISIGISLMVANLASTLILGIIKFAIERAKGIEAFSKVSLILSVSNLIMVFIAALGIVIFPILKKTKEENLPNIYVNLRTFLSIFTVSLMILYYPLRIILNLWLPSYAESLKYMYIVFPILIYDGKISLLINTYYKALRLERTLLVINLTTLLISTSLTLINYFTMNSLEIYIYSIIIILSFRSIFAELILSMQIKVNVFKDIVMESIIVLVFIFININFNMGLSIILFTISYIIFILLKKKKLFNLINYIKL